MNTENEVEILSSSTLHSGVVFDVVREHVRLPSGLEQRMDIVVHGGAVAVAPVFEDGQLLLVRQYRHAVREWVIEIPAGRLEAGEDPLVAAQRELEEETGYGAATWTERIATWPAIGFCSECITIFEARGLELVAHRRAPDPDEEIEVLRMRPEELLAGATRDAKTLLAAAFLLNP